MITKSKHAVFAVAIAFFIVAATHRIAASAPSSVEEVAFKAQGRFAGRPIESSGSDGAIRRIQEVIVPGAPSSQTTSPVATSGIFVDANTYPTIYAALAALPVSGGDVWVAQGAVTSWTGGTLPANTRIHFPAGDVTLTGAIVLSANDGLYCTYGRQLDRSPFFAGTIFTVSGSRSSQDAIDAPQANGVTIDGCTIKMAGEGRRGIYLSGVSDARITYNTIVSSGEDGIRLDNGWQQSYDDTFVGNHVINATGDGFSFRTDTGAADIDRLTLIDNSYTAVVPGGRTSAGANAYHFYVPSGAVTTQMIADVAMINDFGHLGAHGAVTNPGEIYLDYEGNNTSHSFIGGFYISGAEYESDENGGRCTGLKLSSDAKVAINIHGIWAEIQTACSTDTNISVANATNFSFSGQNSTQPTLRSDAYGTQNASSKSPSCRPGFQFFTSDGGNYSLTPTSDGIVHYYRCDTSTDMWDINPNGHIEPHTDNNWTFGESSKRWSAIYGSLGQFNQISAPEGSAPSAARGGDICYGDSSAHALKCSYNNGSFLNVPQVIASGTSTLNSSGISNDACASVVTTSASGVAATDTIIWSYASAPATADGLLILSAYATNGNVNFKLCNASGASQKPSGLVVNWRVVR